jgi:hypothetical protein
MLYEPISKATTSPPTGGVSQPLCGQTTTTPSVRSIDQILARRHARLRQRKQVFPPDFLHGEARVDEIYDVFGELWVEDAIFVEEICDEDGDLVAWTAAWFDGRFLNIEQAVRDEVDDLDGRLADLVDARRSVVKLCIDAPKSVRDRVDLAVGCSLGRLIELEYTSLGVARDKAFSDPRAVYSQRDDVLQDSRTSMLSLVCLCARLA